MVCSEKPSPRKKNKTKMEKPIKFFLKKTLPISINFIALILINLFIIGCASNKQVSENTYDLVFRNINLFDGNKVQPNSTVFVKNGVIKKIEDENEIVQNQGIEIINGNGKTLIPALINSHVHIVESKQLVEAAQAGVLTVIDMFNTEIGKMKLYEDSIGMAQFISAGICVTAPKGHGTQYGIEIPTLDAVDDAKRFINNRKAEGSDFIKIIIERGYPFFKAPTLSDSLFREVINSTKQLDLISVVHISELDDGMMAFRFGANGLAHLWDKNGKMINQEQLEELSKRPSFFIIPTLQVLKRSNAFLKKRAYTTTSLDFSEIKVEVGKLNKNNVQILAGTDPPNFEINYGTDIYSELEDFVEAGLTPIESLKTATSSPAKAFQLEQIGTIESGKWANLIMIDGDPTKDITDIRKIEGIWQKGEKIR